MSALFKYTDADLVSIARNEYKLHPMANLVDYYKLYFQAYYGQGHFIPDLNLARKYLDAEMLNNNQPYYPYLQDISNGKRLYRASVLLIEESIIPYEDYLTIFVRKNTANPDWQEWDTNWSLISKILIELYPVLNDDVLVKYCRKAIETKSILSHSEKFRLTYKPHYRVMILNNTEFETYPLLRKYL
jgi:hypothetical protein